MTPAHPGLKTPNMKKRKPQKYKQYLTKVIVFNTTTQIHSKLKKKAKLYTKGNISALLREAVEKFEG